VEANEPERGGVLLCLLAVNSGIRTPFYCILYLLICKKEVRRDAERLGLQFGIAATPIYSKAYCNKAKDCETRPRENIATL
jgi:hypothetical protein